MYEIRFSPRATRDLRKLSALTTKRILPQIESLTNDPRPVGSKKLAASDDLYRIRIGDYRVVYSISDGIRLVSIRRIGDRKDIYG